MTLEGEDGGQRNEEHIALLHAILNHAKMGVTRIYNQYRYDREKQQALEAWERRRRIAGLEPASAGKIVNLRAAS